MGDRGAIGRIAGALRGHERRLAVAYLLGLALLIAAWLLPSVRTLASAQMKRLTYRAEQRWLDRVAIAHQWVEDGRYSEAERALLRLDADLPADHVKHGLSAERGQVLADLARSYAALGRKRRSLETIRRVVAFEPRNYAHHVLHGALAAQLGEGDEAVQAWQRALAIHANHLPTVRALAMHHAEAGDAEEVVRTFEAYLDAFGTTPVRVQDETLVEALSVDGQWHPFEARVPSPAPEPKGERAPRAVGVVSEVKGLRVSPSWRAGEAEAARGAPLRLRGRIRAFKPVDPLLWATVERACRNLLALERLAELEERTRVVADPGEGIGRDPELAS